MSEVKIVLKRLWTDPENGVWIDGTKLSDVKDVTIYGAAGDIPQVVITMVPKKITLGLDNPDIDQVLPDDQKN
jgi:hypothetical protein